MSSTRPPSATRLDERASRDPVSTNAPRRYTPVSTNALVGGFELLVKVYPDGALSRHLSEMALGDTVEFSHIPKNVKTQYFRRADVPQTSRGDAAAATWIFREDESRRRRGRDVDIP